MPQVVAVVIGFDLFAAVGAPAAGVSMKSDAVVDVAVLAIVVFADFGFDLVVSVPSIELLSVSECHTID